MKTLLLLILSALLLFGCTTMPSQETTIAVSMNPVYELVTAVTGSEVLRIIPGNVDPHAFEPTPGDIARAERAEIIFFYGHDLEPAVDRIIDSLSGDRVIVDLSEGIHLLEGHEHHDHHEKEHHDEEHHEEEYHNESSHSNESDHKESHSDDHHDHEYDPHIWMSPVLAKQQVTMILNALVEYNPDNAEIYTANALAFQAELDIVDAELREIFAQCPNAEILISHEILGYLCAEYGCKQHGIQGLSHEAEPTPRHLAEIIDEAREEGITSVFVETTTPQNHAAYVVANEIGATVFELYSIEVYEGKSYLEKMQHNVQVLREGACPQ